MTETTALPLDDSAELADLAVEGPDRRKVFALVGAGVLVAALIGYFIVLPMLGGRPSPDGAVAPQAARPRPARSALATPKPVPQTFAGVVARDPFEPLVRAPVAAAAATSSTSTSSSSTSTTTSSNPIAPATTPTTPVTASPGTSTTEPGSPPDSTGMVTFKLLTVSGSSAATVSVDGTTYTWTVGRVYLGGFKLIKTGAGGQGWFLYGDMPIHISEGQTYIFAR